MVQDSLSAPPALRTHRRLPGQIGGALALVALAGVVWVGNGLPAPAEVQVYAPRLRGLVTIFFGIFLEALPFLLAGVLVSSAVHLFVTPERLARWVPRSPLGAALAGSALGLVFPVCECGAIPAARSLVNRGAPPALGLAFVLAAPVVNPIVIISTGVAFAGVLGWGFVAWRVGLTIVVAVVTALLPGRDDALLANLSGHEHHHHHEHLGPVAHVLLHAADEFFEMSRYLVIGGLLAATLQTFVPTQTLAAAGGGLLAGPVLLMLLAVVLSVCSTVDAFIALAFVGPFAPPAILAFLVFGPMIDLKSALMLGSTFRPRAVVKIAAVTAGLVLLLTTALGVVWR